MNIVIITTITLWIIWMILFFIHVIKSLGIDGFSIKSFKSRNSKVIIENLKYNFDLLKILVERQNMKIRENDLKKAVMISVKRDIFSFFPRDPFFRFRTIIDYSDSTNTVSIYWDNIWIYQVYIFIIFIPATIAVAFISLIIVLPILLVIFMPFYYLCHKYEMKKVNTYKNQMINILQNAL